jgi:hypothetical protein
MAPTSVVRGKNVKIGKNVVIQTNSLFMSAGFLNDYICALAAVLAFL